MLEPFHLPFVQRGLLEILILAIPAGLLGTWIALRGLAFFSHAVGTAAFPGLVVADGLGFAAPLGALAAAGAFGAGTLALGRRDSQDDGSAVALALVASLAAGAILANDVFGSGANVETLLFGSLLLVDGRDIALAAASALSALGATVLLGRHWLARGFDPGDTAAAHAAGERLDAALLGLVALAIVAAVSVVGALLVAALFVIPSLTARLLTERLASWQVASVALVAAEGIAGLWLSVRTDAPPGATIACVAGAVFAATAVSRRLPQLARRLALPGLALAALGAAAIWGPGAGVASGRVQVVATTTQIADWARVVGGPGVSVEQLLKPNTDPHEYEPRPSDVEAAAGADLVLANGDGLDDWAGAIVSDGGGDADPVELGSGVPMALPSKGEAEGSKVDPHWWQDPRNAEAAVREIERLLEQADPAHRAVYRRNADSYLARLRGLDRSIAVCMRSIPASRRRLVTDHDAFEYFARRYGIRVVGAVIPSQTTAGQASARDLHRLTETIESEGVAAIFPESSLSPKVANAIAAQTGAAIGAPLYGDSLGPAGSAGATYLSMERWNADAIARGLTDGRRGCVPSP